MIYRAEIDSKAQEFDIHPVNVQRDYMFSWILYGIYYFSELADHLILKGGNCLRKGYLKNTRFSSDLDFSVKYSIHLDTIGRELNQICNKIEEITGIKFHVEKNKFEKKNRVDKSLIVYDARQNQI